MSTFLSVLFIGCEGPGLQGAFDTVTFTPPCWHMYAPLLYGGLLPVGTQTEPLGQHSSAPGQFVAFAHGQHPVRVALNCIGEQVAVAGQRALVQLSPPRHSSGQGSSASE
jgi:hypothetical protein